MAVVFDLTQNPFYLLGVSMRARRAEVAEAHEEALANGRADEALLMRAQQAILTPRSRIEAEVSWLPGLSPSHAKEILLKLQRGAIDDTCQAMENLQGLDKANLAADLCVRAAGETRHINELLEAYEEFTAEDVLETLTGVRSISGFPATDRQQVEKALAILKVSHAKAAVACISAADGSGKEMTEIVEAFLGWGNDAVGHLLDLIVREYDAWSEPRLGSIKERIEVSISTCRGGRGPIPVDQFVKMLAEWDSISQPVQLLEESKGHEEPRSKEIYGIVRDFCLWLSNEKSQYDEALVIARALLETFPELPAVAAQLSQDVDVLESLAEEAKSIKLLGPLIETQAAIQARISTFDKDLAASGFGLRSRGLAKKLYDGFADVAARTAGTEFADMPWMVVRGLAIELNNKHDSPDGACTILDGLLSHTGTMPSKAVVEKLRIDQRTLRRNHAWKELRRISGNIPKGLSLISELLSGADENERQALLRLKAALEQKKSANTMKRGFWWLAAAAFIGFLIYDANQKPPYSPHSSSTAASKTSTFQSSTRPSTPPSSWPSQFEEQKPPPGRNRTFNRNEVRYCVFQEERLDILRYLVSSNSEIDQFNAFINDYNSRCSSFRYREGVLQAVQAEAAGRRQELRMDAMGLLASWRGSSSSSLSSPFSASSSASESLIDITGSSGAMRVQSRLKELGYYTGSVDGIWGPASRAALRNFKSSQFGVAHDDRWDLATQRALMGH